MKKDIRTKVGIFQVRKPALDEYLWEDATYVYRHEHIDNKDIIKRADTIEELCDTFVITNHGTDSNFLMEDFEVVKENFKDNSIVYGAIWTDKGLKYVAKMNDKGELELL